MPLIDLANPTRFLALSGRLLPWLGAATVIAFALGLWLIANAPDGTSKSPGRFGNVGPPLPPDGL